MTHSNQIFHYFNVCVLKHNNKPGHWLEMGYVPSITYNIPKQPFQLFYRIDVLKNFEKFEENTAH